MGLHLFLQLLFCVSAVVSQENSCVWDSDEDVNQGLDPDSIEEGATYAASLPEVQDDELCRDRCCGRSDCHLALIGTPADGLPQCFLINCMKNGQDVCTLMPSTQFRSYRKTGVKIEPRSLTNNTSTSTSTSSNSSTGKRQALFNR